MSISNAALPLNVFYQYSSGGMTVSGGGRLWRLVFPELSKKAMDANHIEGIAGIVASLDNFI